VIDTGLTSRLKHGGPFPVFLSYLSTGLSHNTILQELNVHVPLSPTNNEQIMIFFNVISKMNDLTEIKVNYKLVKLSYSNSSSYEEMEQIIAPLYYEHVLTCTIQLSFGP
jgi:late competence protein required for DNA uptake (superfamily II DNA/RNA helicase)